MFRATVFSSAQSCSQHVDDCNKKRII